MKFNIACIQTNTQNDLQENISKISLQVSKAANMGADFVTMPENAFFMGKNAEELLLNSFFENEHPAILKMQELAAQLKIWILIGSVAVKIANSEKLANRSIVIDNSGKIVSTYDKIHLYDVQVEGEETHRESSRFVGGDKATICKTPWCDIGLTICYDVRFPHLYRKLAKSGAKIITVPSAFTKFTGQAHWHTLLKARAIENACFIAAPAQTGTHPSQRQTFGHSLIIDPWGDVLQDGGKSETIIIAEVDTEIVDKIRKQLPSLEHDRLFV
jgi:predicted amidohydrolase